MSRREIEEAFADGWAVEEIRASRYEVRPDLTDISFGEGGPMSERGETSIGGRIPVNPSGGLESKGHPVGATGIAQVHELVTQLRGEAGARQVDGARVALAENGGGLVGIEEAVACITILAR